MSTEEAPWKSIAARKQAERASKIPHKWHIPSKFLPKDPAKAEDGPQNVFKVPASILSPSERRITEDYDVTTLLAAIAERKLSAAEVAEAFCHRAAIVHQLTNCLTEPLFDSALRRAGELDNYYKTNGRPLGPLHGLPVSVKDGFKVKGVDASLGIASLCFKPADSNAPLVDILLSLGCIIIAKTNIPQTLASLDSINNVFGRTMNPANRLLTAGGSSGGEGVMVAMRGSMIGFGTDIGGSIRVPAMCNGIFGFKPSVGRIPYGGQQNLGLEGLSRASVQAVAGPIARSVRDIDLVMSIVVPQAKLFAEDCFTSSWDNGISNKTRGSGAKGEFVVGVLRSDGNCELLPPIRNVINEVADRLRLTPGVQVVELKTPPAWTRCQSVMNKLMGVEGSQTVFDLLDATQEPLVPWLTTRMRRGKPQVLARLAEIQAQRSQLEREMLSLWVAEDKYGRRQRKIDAILCPLAPHPVPEIERYNSVGYTSSWVLLDMPAAAVPVRDVRESDLELGRDSLPAKPISTWDEKCRELWSEDKTDRRVYLGSKLSVQLVVPRAEDQSLIRAMDIVDGAVNPRKGPTARL